MKIETTASGIKMQVSGDEPTKRWSTDVETVPINQRRVGDEFYVQLRGYSFFLHATLVAKD